MLEIGFPLQFYSVMSICFCPTFICCVGDQSQITEQVSPPDPPRRPVQVTPQIQSTTSRVIFSLLFSLVYGDGCLLLSITFLTICILFACYPNCGGIFKTLLLYPSIPLLLLCCKYFKGFKNSSVPELFQTM